MYFQNMKGIYYIPPYFENTCFAILPFMDGRQNSGAILILRKLHTSLHTLHRIVRLTDTEVNALNCRKLSSKD